ncbi:hypothetical protein EZV62_027846 [Acer yangbiense]|uniref:Uncharacterized protein n=1 Tax=Acer yangbiense TaxID=1000413 RepID=A0A5C7GQP2_9ROSI|nr:hypothetical protein EZV62_027846 [Acer yangbiense]
MSSIGQSILMALTVTVNKYASSNVQAVHRRSEESRTKTTTADFGRRGLLLSTALAAAPPQLSDSANQLLKKYLKKSEANKEKNDKEVGIVSIPIESGSTRTPALMAVVCPRAALSRVYNAYYFMAAKAGIDNHLQPPVSKLKLSIR